MPSPCDLLLYAAHILCRAQDDALHGLADGAVAVADGVIRALGTRTDMAPQWQARRELDLGNALLLPGLINAHTHASMTLFRGIADDLPLMEWLNKHIFPLERRLTRRFVRLGALLGCAEMLRTGTSAFQDMYLMEDEVCRAADLAGLRCLAGEVVFSFPTLAVPRPETAPDLIRAQAARWKRHPRVRIAVMPHAVYTTNPEILRNCMALAEELDLPLHMHLAESAAESARCMAMHGKRPIPYCRDLGLLAPRTSLAHVVDATDEELDILAQSGACVVHNPSSNMKLASGVARVPAMLERGMRLALGTDGAASNNRLNMFTEMGRAALLHKAARQDPSLCPAGTIFAAATSGGASALGDTRLGALAAGRPADIIALDLDSPNLQPLYTPVSHVVYAATGMEVRMNMVDGEILYLDGCFTRFSYPDLLAEIQDIQQEVRTIHGALTKNTTASA
ncbi:MAG: amidohydrolase [Deltaproteobacteria bacterium]|jgi:5-methylthioadenosine/S-adenosylhomocysteine deaminase|nr:amidohydrolase [Deltaproteobacteria bacterium]